MIHDFVRQIQSIRVLDQRPARFTGRRIPPEGNIIFEIRNDTGGSIASLDCDGFEEEFHGVDESFLSSWGTFGYEAGPVTRRGIEWLAAPTCRREMQTFSSAFRRESLDRTCVVGGRWT